MSRWSRRSAATGSLVREPDRAAPGAGAGLRVGPADPGQRPHRPRGRLPAQVEPGLTAGGWPASWPTGRRRESTAIAGGRFKLVPQDGQGYVFRDQFVFGGLRRREAP